MIMDPSLKSIRHQPAAPSCPPILDCCRPPNPPILGGIRRVFACISPPKLGGQGGRKSLSAHILKFGLLAIAAGGLLASSKAAQAVDPKYNWPALQQVHRIGVIIPYFCTSTPDSKPANAQDRAYQQGLNALETSMRKALSRCLAEGDRFRVMPLPMMDRVLRRLHLMPRNLFLQSGLAQGKQWPAPDVKRIAALAKRLNVDAIFVGSMREPASIGDSMQFHHEAWNPNPLAWNLQRIRPHVVSPRVQAFLITKQSVIAWQDEEMADHPRTKQRTARTLLIDWQEATEEVAQQLADSLLRLPPPGLEAQ